MKTIIEFRHYCLSNYYKTGDIFYKNWADIHYANSKQLKRYLSSNLSFYNHMIKKINDSYMKKEYENAFSCLISLWNYFMEKNDIKQVERI